VLDRRNPLHGIEVKGVRAVVKAALPALDGLAVGLLANMAQVALDGSATSASGAGMLEREVPENLDDGVGHISVVIWTIHITALS